MSRTLSDILELPIGKEFITGEIAGSMFNPPGREYYANDENGNRQLGFGKNAVARITDQLWKMPALELGDEYLDQRYEAINQIGQFVRDFRVWYEPNDHKLLPRIEYKLFPAAVYPIVIDPNNPKYIQYKSQLLVLRQLRAAERHIPEALINYLNQAEAELFLGSDNERKMTEVMHRAIAKQFQTPVVMWAILTTLYSPEEFTELYKKHVKPNEGARKSGQSEKRAELTTHRIPGHFVDQQLKYTYPPDRRSAGQLNIFESLPAHLKSKITNSGVSTQTIVEGIPLTPSENKLVISLTRILAKNSQTTDTTKLDYYSGSEARPEDSLVDYGGSKEVAPRLLFTLHELAKEYTGGENPSGKDIINVKAVLQGLAKKQYLISYIQKTPLGGGKNKEQKIEEFMPLVRVLKYSETITDSDGSENSRAETMLLALNPVFRHKIDTKFIEIPSDLNRRTMIAYGSHNLPDATVRLRDHLLRELSAKHTKHQIGLDRLYYLLCEKWMNEGRHKRVAEYTDKAIETIKALGVIKDYELVSSKTEGNKKIIFHLNRDFPAS